MTTADVTGHDAGHDALPVPPELDAAHWRPAAAALAAKLLAELCFEGALQAVPEEDPVPGGTGDEDAAHRPHRVAVGSVTYTFRGRRAALDTWRIDPSSVERVTADGRGPVDPMRLLLDLHEALGLDPAVTALTVQELSATLSADAWLLATGLSSADLADLSHLELEGYQGGHPWLVANKGRVGFSAADRARYAPEARRPRPLPWIAVHEDLATYSALPDLDRSRLLTAELGAGRVSDWTARLAARVPEPDRYVWLPVHPWQWDEVLVRDFAAEIAAGLIVPLGEGPDRYLPQQSIRTFGNIDTPGRLDVKVSLSILNTMVYRGIPSELVDAAPHGTAWLHALRDGDRFLAEEHRLVLPGEIAAVSVRHPVLESLPDAPYRYKQLLGVIWREPLRSLLEPGERARTFASLLHVDPAGRAFVAELVHRSGLPPAEWLDRLLGVILPPLLHLLVRYGLAVNPHGENATIVYDTGDVPVRLAVKDFVDDMKLLDLGDLPVTDPARARRLATPEHDLLPRQTHAVLLRTDADDLVGSLAKSVLLAHFRYLAPLCEEQLDVPESTFWALARGHVAAYRARFPELAERWELLDLGAPTLPRVCLNRERLLPAGYHDRAERDAHFSIDAAPLANPLHPEGPR